MKNWKSFVMPAIFLVIILAGAVFAYTELTKGYTEDPVSAPQTVPVPGADGEETAAAARESAPDFTVMDGDGNAVSLSDFAGKPVVINFWATWCGPCQMEMPYFEEAWQTYGEDVTFLMVNLTDGYQDTVDGVKEFIADAGYTFPVYYDTEMNGAAAYGVYSIPLTILVDRDGNLYDSHLGAMSRDTLNGYLEALTAEE